MNAVLLIMAAILIYFFYFKTPSTTRVSHDTAPQEQTQAAPTPAPPAPSATPTRLDGTQQERGLTRSMMDKAETAVDDYNAAAEKRSDEIGKFPQ